MGGLNKAKDRSLGRFQILYGEKEKIQLINGGDDDWVLNPNHLGYFSSG